MSEDKVTRIGKLTAADVIKQAEQEHLQELAKDAAGKLKGKLRELASARKVVANIEREIEDIKLRMEQELG